MRVQHNIASMNSYRNYNNNTRSINKNLEKLSSGYRINRAGDDAAGLAISEKMRAQITGLEGAQKNAKDGISLVQTAEGALTEVHSMLNRMYSLAEQSANGTYDDSTDRLQLQKEVDALKTEIDRIADSSNFNGTKLLDGSLSGTGGTTATAVKLGENITTKKISATNSSWTGGTAVVAGTDSAPGFAGVVDDDNERLTFTLEYSIGVGGKSQTATVGFNHETDDAGKFYLVADSGRKYALANTKGTDAEIQNALKSELDAAVGKHFTFEYDSNKPKFTSTEKGAAAATVVAFGATAYKASGVAATVAISSSTVTNAKTEGKNFNAGNLTAYTGASGGLAEDAVFTINGQKFAIANVASVGQEKIDALGKGVTVLDVGSAGKLTAEHAKIIQQKTGLEATFVGTAAATGEQADSITLRGGSGTTGSGGLQLQIGDTADSWNQMSVNIDDIHSKAIGISTADITTVDSAAASMADIKDAIDYVSNVRGGLGAIQNRLEHTINNLSVMQENIQDAESTIRDTDVADEMMKYTKNSILVQSAQAMLAQANQQPQGVLQLLQ